VLGDLPFIGVAFSSVLHSEDEQELIVLVTPHLVDGQDCRQSPKRLPGRETRKPDDYELFLESILEAPRGQRQVFEDGKYKAAYKNDPSYNQYPCADPLPREPRNGRGRRGSYGCTTGNCGTMQPAYAPAAMPRMRPGSPEMMPAPASGSPLLPGPAMPGPSLAPDARMIPPTAVETLPGPKSSRANPDVRGGNRAPTIPPPRFDDDPSR
jgi:pilus assembly protein CpaC